MAGKSSEVGSFSECFENHCDLLVHLFVLFSQHTHFLATQPLGDGRVFSQDSLSPQMDQKKKSLGFKLFSAFHLLVIPTTASCVVRGSLYRSAARTWQQQVLLYSPSFSISPSFKINVLCATLFLHGLIRASREGVLELVSLSPAARILSHLSRMLDNKLMRRWWWHP